MGIGVGTEPGFGEGMEAAYIEGLRAFFAGHGLRFGEPRDLISLAARTAGEACLAEEMRARLGAIVRCEGERLRRGLLMRMVVVAGGGPAVVPGQPELQEALWQIAGWVETAFEEAGSGVGE